MTKTDFSTPSNFAPTNNNLSNNKWTIETALNTELSEEKNPSKLTKQTLASPAQTSHNQKLSCIEEVDKKPKASPIPTQTILEDLTLFDGIDLSLSLGDVIEISPINESAPHGIVSLDQVLAFINKSIRDLKLFYIPMVDVYVTCMHKVDLLENKVFSSFDYFYESNLKTHIVPEAHFSKNSILAANEFNTRMDERGEEINTLLRRKESSKDFDLHFELTSEFLGYHHAHETSNGIRGIVYSQSKRKLSVICGFIENLNQSISNLSIDERTRITSRLKLECEITNLLDQLKSYNFPDFHASYTDVPFLKRLIRSIEPISISSSVFNKAIGNKNDPIVLD